MGVSTWCGFGAVAALTRQLKFRFLGVTDDSRCIVGIHLTRLFRMEDLSVVPPVHRRQLLVLLSVSYALLACGLSVTVALPELRRSVQMSDTVTSLHGSFFGWALLLLGLFGSRVMVSFGNLRVLLAGTASVGVGAVLFGSAHVVGQSLSGGALIGLGGAAVVTAIPGIVADTFGDERNAIFTRLNVAPAFGGLSFPLLISAAPSLGTNWRLPTVALPAVLLAAVVVLSLPELRRTRERSGLVRTTEWRDVLVLLRLGGVRRRFALQVLEVGVEFSLASWLVVFLREQGGFSKAAAPIGGAAWAVGMMTSRALTPRLIVAFRNRLEASCLVGGIVCALCILAIPIAWLRLVAVALTSFSFGPMYSLGVERLFVNAEQAGVVDTVAVSSLAAVASGVAITLGPFVVGVVADRAGLTSALLLVPGLGALALALCLVRWGNEAGRSGQPFGAVATA